MGLLGGILFLFKSKYVKHARFRFYTSILVFLVGLFGLTQVGKGQSQSSSQWTMYMIDGSSFGADGTKLGYANLDSLPDVVTGWEQGHVARLYFNPGPKQAVRPWPYVQLPSSGQEDAFLADLNGDGFKDVVTCSEDTTKHIAFHWAPSKWSKYESSKYWKSAVVPVTEDKKWMFGQPMNVDHKNGVDLIVGAKGHQGTIGWLESPTNPQKVEQWKYHEISKAGWIMSIKKIDVNHDGRKDILISDRYKKNHNARGVRWLENPGPGPALTHRWKSRVIGLQNAKPMFLTVADVDVDGRKDIIAQTMHNGIFAFLRTSQDGWTRKKIPFSKRSGHRGKGVAVGDINGNGKPDIVTSYEKADGRAGVMWTSHPLNSQRRTNHIVSGAAGVKFDLVKLIDMDGDGALDILTSEENNNSANVPGLGVVWYKNPFNKSR